MENELKPIVNISTPNLANVAAESVTINWDYEIEGASPEDVRFEVAVKGEMADGTPWIRFEAPEKNTCTITGLKPDTKYSIFVVAIHENEDIAQAPDSDDGVVVTTSANTPPPAAPKKKPWKTVAIIIGSVLAGMALFAGIYSFILALQEDPVLGEVTYYRPSDTEIRLFWYPPTDNMTKPDEIEYKIHITDEDGNSDYILTGKGASLGHTPDKGEKVYNLTGLKPNTEYKIIVYAIDKQGNYSDGSEVTVKTTDQVGPVVNDPKVLAYYVPSEHRIDIMWTAATDEGTAAEKIRYKVYWKALGKWMFIAGTVGETSYSYKISDVSTSLLSTTPLLSTMTFTVDAIDEVGNSTRYDPVELKF